MYDLAIIIPARNEEKRIERTLKTYLDYFNLIGKKEGMTFKIILVLNACSDRTYDIAKRHSGKSLEILNFKKGGKGFAVIRGFRQAIMDDAKIIGFVDADMATKPEHFYDLVLNVNGYGGAIASRYMRSSKVYPKNTFARITASRIYNAFIRAMLLIPYRDTQCGAKAFSRRSLMKVIDNIGMTQWAFDIELVYRIRKEGFSIVECPTTWSSENYSTINFWKTGPWMALAVLRLRILYSPFKFIIRLYDKTLGKIHSIIMGGNTVK